MHTHGTEVEMFLKNTVWLSPQSICCAGGRGWECGREEGKKAVIFVTAIVFSNKETSSLVWCRRRYHASAAWLSKSKNEDGRQAKGRKYTMGDSEVPSQAGLFFCHLLSLLLRTGMILHYIMKSLTLSPTHSPITQTTLTEHHRARVQSMAPAVFFHQVPTTSCWRQIRT